MYDASNDRSGIDTAQQGPSKPEARFGKPLEPYRVFRAYVHAKWFLLLAVIAAFGLAVFVVKTFFPRRYASEVPLVWEPGEDDDTSSSMRALLTRVSQMKVPKNLEKIRERSHLAEPLYTVAGRISIQSDEESNLIAVRAVAESPEAAQQLADIATQVFLESERNLAQGRAQDRVEQARRDLASARTALTEARAAYDAFRSANGISDLSIETQQAIDAAADLSAQAELERARAATARSSGRRSGVRTDLTRGEKEMLRQRIAEAKGRLAQARAQYSEEHPRVQTIAAEVRQMEEELRAADRIEVSPTVVRDPAPRPSSSAPPSESTIARLASQARQRLAQLSAVEGEASSLLAAVRVDEAHVTELEAAAAKASDSARTPNAGFRRVSEPTRPELPEQSGRRVIGIAIVLGTILFALLGVLFWALRGLRVYTANEYAFWGRAPVVGSSTWPQPPHTLKALIDELSDFTPTLKGTTLVVAATDRDRTLAEAVATRLQLAVPAADTITVDDDDPPTQFDWAAPLSGGSTALALPPSHDGPMTVIDRVPASSVELWKGEISGPQLRRAARSADRVLVVAASGGLSIGEAAEIRTRVGRAQGVAFVVLGLAPDLVSVPDRAGPVEAFWLTRA